MSWAPEVKSMLLFFGGVVLGAVLRRLPQRLWDSKTKVLDSARLVQDLKRRESK
jgi:hypothetical protein